jgi:hypothetical protein
LSKNTAKTVTMQVRALNHNKCYRKGGGCVKISVTEEVNLMEGG